jgi:hypothetical protein
MEVNKTKKPITKSFVLAGFVAICLIVMPALAVPTGDFTPKTQCNASGKSNYDALEPGMRAMWNPAMGNPGMDYVGMMKMNKSWNGTKTIETHRIGSGFAMSGNQYHVLRMNIESKVTLNPANLKKLISENKTLGQIKSDLKAEIKAEMSAASINGSPHLGQSKYNLVNTN